MASACRRFLLSTALMLVVAVAMASCGVQSSDSNPAQAEPSAVTEETTLPTTTGAAAPPSPTTKPVAMTPQEIAMGAIKASQSMKSVGFDLEFSMSLGLPNTGTMNMQQTGSGRVDITDKEMDLTFAMTMDIPNQGKQSGTGEMVTTNGWLYMKTAVSGGADQWTKMKLTDEMWAAQNRLTSTTALLSSPVGLEISGSEVMRGVDCYVLSINPDMASLSNWVAGQTQPGQNTTNLGGSDLSKALDSFTVKEWIRKDTLLPAKALVQVKLDPTSSGSSTTTAMQMSVAVTFTDYGKSVDITLPAEALNAKELVTTK